MEAVEPFTREVLGGSEVEVGIKLVNNTLEPQNRKQPRGEGCRDEKYKCEQNCRISGARAPFSHRMAAVERASSLRNVSCFSEEMR